MLRSLINQLFGRETITDFLAKDQFWMPEPAPPLRDARAWSLALPAAAGVVGLCAFAALAFVAPELEWLPAAFRTNTALWGALTLAIAGEGGTFFTNIEIFRKVMRKEQTGWDWSAFVTSLLATMLAFLLGTAALLPDAPWSHFALTWLRILLIAVAALDQYAGQMELGLYCGSYDQRHQEWEAEFKKWRREMAEWHGAAVAQPTAGLPPEPPPASDDTPTMPMPAVKAAPEPGVTHCPACGATTNGKGVSFDDQPNPKFALAGHQRHCAAYLAQRAVERELVYCPDCGATKSKDGKLFSDQPDPQAALAEHQAGCNLYQQHHRGGGG